MTPIVIRAGDGTDTMHGFVEGADRIALSGLTFDELSIHGNGDDTIIRLVSSGEDLLVLKNINSSSIDSRVFINWSSAPVAPSISSTTSSSTPTQSSPSTGTSGGGTSTTSPTTPAATSPTTPPASLPPTGLDTSDELSGGLFDIGPLFGGGFFDFGNADTTFPTIPAATTPAASAPVASTPAG
ncbi:MAG: hypothetical protein ACJ0GU_07850 [Gammaproteobacteria bacterium]